MQRHRNPVQAIDSLTHKPGKYNNAECVFFGRFARPRYQVWNIARTHACTRAHARRTHALVCVMREVGGLNLHPIDRCQCRLPLNAFQRVKVWHAEVRLRDGLRRTQIPW